MTDTGWYLYCVAEGTEPPNAGPGLTVCTCRDLHAIIGAVDPAAFAALDALPSGQVSRELADLVVEHDRVIQAVFASHPVLPMRFGTGVQEPDAVAGYLADRYDAFKAQLDRLRHHAEWGVRWWCPQPPVAAAVPAADAGESKGRDYLRRRQQQLQAGVLAARSFREQVERHHQALAAHAAAVAPGAVRSDDERSCSYLVHREQEEVFVATAQDRAGIDVHLTGPWPPYSFCSAID